MIGTLGITPQGWKVSFEYWFIAPNGGVCDRSQLKECLYIRELPLHPDDNPDYEFGRDVVGEQIEFEMVWYKDVKYAKLINVDKLGNEDVPKLGYDERKQNLIDIMNDDAKDGLYDVREVVEDDVEKLQQDAWDNYEHEEGNLYSTTFRNAFKLGYNKAKETLYTEEDMIRCWKYASIDNHQVFGDQIGDNYKSFIQSLKQPKKD